MTMIECALHHLVKEKNENEKKRDNKRNMKCFECRHMRYVQCVDGWMGVCDP